MNERAKELARVGRQAWFAGPAQELSPEEDALICAFAAMLACPPAPKRKKEAPKLAFSPQELHARLAAQCGDKVVCFPYQHSTFGRLGKDLQDVSDLEFADLERLCAWINAGGLSWAKGALSFAAFAKMVGKSIALAREWDKRGRQNLRKGDNVGQSTAQEDVGSRFR